MEYPRQLHLDAETENNLISYLNDELSRHRMESSRWRDDLIQQQHAYWAEPSDEQVTFPFVGASNLVIPLNAIAVEAVHARNMQTMFAIEDQIVNARATSPDWADAERPVERYLQLEFTKNIKIRRPINDVFLEIEKFGTGVLKTGYNKIIKRAMKESGELFDVTTFQGATLDCVPVSRFMMPYSSQDPQKAPWCGELHADTPHEIRNMDYAGLFKTGTYEKIYKWITTTSNTTDNQFQESQADLENRPVILPAYIHWVEIWLSWNVDKDPSNKEKEIVVYYHEDTNTIMSVRYNWYDDLRRPYDSGVYFPVEHRWAGIGICKMNNQFQEEITTRHRLQLDNATLANIQMFKVNKQSGYGPNEPIFPGKIWYLDDLDHIDSLRLGEVYPSAYNSEQSSLNYSQQRLGINELTLGQPGVGTPGTASDTLSRIQEGNKKFGFLYSNLRTLASNSFTNLVCEIQQFGPSDTDYFTSLDGGHLVEKFLKMPASKIRSGMLLDLSCAGQTDNKFQDRQNAQQLAQVYQQYIEGNIQLAQMAGDPALLGEIIKRGLAGSAEIMKTILSSFDLPNLDRVLIQPPALTQEQNVANQPGGTGGTTLPSEDGGVANPPQSNSQPQSIVQ